MKNVRYDQHGKLVCLAEANGYVMVRRPYCVPSVMTLKAWSALSEHPL